VSNKNKKATPSTTDKLIADIGFIVMSAAAVVSLLELHEARMPKVAPSVHSGINALAESIENRVEATVRREKEETAHTMVSYGQAMRSHAVSGKA
jgi:uncharacterized protein with PIN domain